MLTFKNENWNKVANIVQRFENGITTQQLEKIAWEELRIGVDGLYHIINELQEFGTIYSKNGKWFVEE